MTRTMLTTIDNPYDPFDQYEEWYEFDEAMGYCTCGLLDRVCYNSDELSEADQKLAIDLAIQEIIQFNASGMHTIVTREVE